MAYRNEWNLARTTANNICTQVANDQIFPTIFHAHKHIDTAYVKLQNAKIHTGHMELQLQIEERWVIDSQQYKCYKQEASMGKYCAALDELEQSWSCASSNYRRCHCQGQVKVLSYSYDHLLLILPVAFAGYKL